MPNINRVNINKISAGLNTSEKKEFDNLLNENVKNKKQIESLNNNIKTLNDKITILNRQNKKIPTLEQKILKLNAELLKYKDLKKIKPMMQNDFNKFIANSVKDLQKNLSSDENSDYEFIIRDVEIEALVSTENRNGNIVYIIPTSTQLKDIDGSKLQKLKYSLSMASKI